MERNNAVSIAKGIAIILVVIGHAEMPGLLNRSIYMFHMPLFFITAGYFFSHKAIEKPFVFIKKRFKGIYWPFLKYSLFFLFIHNWLFDIGVYNSVYGNWTGGVIYPYTTEQFWNKFQSIIFSMSGYDVFLAGAFWFFRALFVVSIVFLILYLLLNKIKWLKDKTTTIPLIIAFIGLGIGFILAYKKMFIPNFPQGGFRDTMGLMFFAIGVLYRKYEHCIGHNLIWSFVGAVIVILAAWLKFSGMNIRPLLQDPFTLPLTGIAGWIMTYNFSVYLAKFNNSRLVRGLIYCGNHTLYVFVWHVAAYKLVSLIKIWIYDLDPRQISCHMVIHDYSADDYFWIWYTIAGVGIPLVGYYYYSKYISPRLPKISNLFVKHGADNAG